MKSPKSAGGFLLLHYRFFFLAVIIIFASCVVSDPLQNIKNVLMLQAPYILIYAFGMTMAILTGGLDLSIGSTAALASCLAGFVIIKGNVTGGILVGVAVGAFIGLINGVLITKAKIAPFIATYGMDWVVRGAAYIIMAGITIFGFNETFRGIASGELLGLSNLFCYAIVIFIILLAVFQGTTFGRRVYMTGSNIHAARLTGIDTDLIIMIVYIISGMLAAIAGILYVARLDAAEPFLGKNFGLLAIAATLIGGTSLEGGKGGMANTVLGVLIMVFLVNALNVLKVSVLWQDAAFGMVIIVSALLEKFRSAYMNKRLA